MRVLILGLFLLFPAVALAAGWTAYQNPRFGYAIEIPPGFSGRGEAGNGDGQVFAAADGTALLHVWGGNVMEADFEAAARAGLEAAAAAGWALSYERVTPSWASWSGTRNGMVLYARSITLCGGSQYARFELEYPERALVTMDAVVNRLVQSLAGTGGAPGC